jgi:N-acetylneuraminate synthase
LDLPILKIGSGDLTFGPLLLAAARSGKKIILSTGMATLDEIQHALHVISFGLQHAKGNPSLSAPLVAMRDKVTLLHCVSDYPAKYQDMNLNVMKILSTTFQLEVGLSDHTEGITIPIAAVALGCTVLEKHFTLDKSLEGPDHLASLNPSELAQMISSIRIVESALGNGHKTIHDAEQKNRSIVRRSIVAKHEIKMGEIFSENNISFKRPEGGLSPMKYWELLGKQSDRDYVVDEVIHA